MGIHLVGWFNIEINLIYENKFLADNNDYFIFECHLV